MPAAKNRRAEGLSRNDNEQCSQVSCCRLCSRCHLQRSCRCCARLLSDRQQVRGDSAIKSYNHGRCGTSADRAMNCNEGADRLAQLTQLTGKNEWERVVFIEEGGSAKMPGNDGASRGVARMCAELIVAEN